MVKNKALLLSVISILIVTLSLSYAFFYYKETLNDISLSSGEISINFDLDNNSYNALLEHTKSDALGKIDYNYYDFTVSGSVNHETIYYEIQIKENSGNTLDTKYLKVYLTDQDDHEIIGPLVLSDLEKNDFNNNKIVYSNYLLNSLQGDKYRLRLWISDDYELGTSQTFSFKIVLYARNSEIKSKDTLYSKVESQLGTNVMLYTGNHQDSIRGVGSKNIYYYYGQATMNNVIFGDYCWQIVRTTDTGGVKLIYNGRPVNGECSNVIYDSNGNVTSTGRENQQGVVQNGRYTYTLTSDYYYGTSFTVDYVSGRFSLSGNLVHGIWSDDNYEQFIGKYTCLSTSKTGTCTQLRYIEGYNSSSGGRGPRYAIDNINYSLIGRMGYDYVDYLGRVGYMHNKDYIVYSRTHSTNSINGVKFANSYSYIDGDYTLNDDVTVTISNWTNDYNKINNTHYTCFNSTGVCGNKIYYVYRTKNDVAYYYILDNNKKIDYIIDEMLHSQNVNMYDSTIKSYIDNWYYNNLLDYTNYIEETIYCNDRSIITNNSDTYAYSKYGFNPNGGDTTATGALYFSNYYYVKNLVCPSLLDSFSIRNDSAKLDYSIGLLSQPEFALARNSANVHYLRTTSYYWTMSPYYFGNNSSARISYVNSSGGVSNTWVYNYSDYGVRPVISLKAGVQIVTGNGSSTFPFRLDFGKELYTVTFDANGGSGEMSPQVIQESILDNLKNNAFTRTNYTFIGWNTMADGSGVGYANQAVSNLSSDITLYAQWVSNSNANVNASDYITTRLKYNGDGLVAVNTSGQLYDGTGTIREYRYSGGSPNNYIYFNGNELWRIVGVFNGQLKIIKDTGISGVPTSYTNNNSQTWSSLGTSNTNSDGSQQVYWNGTQYGTNKNDWTTAGLMYYLNEKTNENSYYYNLNSSYKGLIDSSTTYYLGNVDVYTNEVTPSDVYNQERNTTNIHSGNQGTWNGSSTLGGIGLLYPSDFGYAEETSTWTNSRTQLQGTTASNNWLYYASDWYWTISPAASYAWGAMNWGNHVVSSRVTWHDSVRPVLHLISTAQIDLTQGDGTSANPYRLVVS